MLLMYSRLTRSISLLLWLLFAAASWHQAGCEVNGANWPSYWPLKMSKNSQRDFQQNGRPLPNFRVGEMTSDNAVDGDADVILAKAFNFPQLPMPLSERRWRQQYNDKMKEMQVQQTTWLGQLPYPAVGSRAKLKRGSAVKYLMDDPLSSYGSEQLRESKRQSLKFQGNVFKPSISAGVMTNLGEFFNQLKANVHFAEHSQQLKEAESQLLEGLHKPQINQDEADNPSAAGDNDYDSGQPPERKQAIYRNYRPSQKIRSLVSRNPSGYRGSQFIDPSYMWLGLGK